MAAGGDTSMSRYDSSAGELSSPPSGSLSEPTSPRRSAKRNNDMEEIIVGNDKHGIPPPPHQTTPNGTQKRFGWVEGQWVQLTAAGLPRKKPGRKPGSVVKPKPAAMGATSLGANANTNNNPTTSTTPPATTPATTPASATTAATINAGDASDSAANTSKARRPRKPRDPNAPPIQRKRKIAPADLENEPSADSKSLAAAAAASSRQPRISDMSNFTSAASSPAQQHHSDQQRYSPKMPKRDGYPSSMQSILNADPPAPSPSQPQPPTQTQSQPQSSASNTHTVPVRTSGQSYDPIRGNYDPVRETMSSHNPFSSKTASPRAPAQVSNRSPSIASLIEPSGPPMRSPTSAFHQPATTSQTRVQAQDSMPPSPSTQPAQPVSTPTPAPRPQPVPETKKDPRPPPPPAPRPVIKESNFTTISNGPVKRSPKQKPQTGLSTPQAETLDDMPQEGEGRSILDFGRAKPGEETQAPTIVLEIPIENGETNKYVNFMRLAEDRFGWDALHPRLAANRARKARIAAAAASLEKAESGRESGDEMSVDLSDVEGSNAENGAVSGPDAQAKPKKKRNFKEDQYDIDDDFVDDSELLWEAQAAASRDGFFVYSGPLVPEVEKPAAGTEAPPKRGRGSRGGRGGARGAATRGGAAAGRGGGPGSRGGSVTRKPRITKSEKAQREREKAERESMLTKTPTNGSYVLQPTTPSLTVGELGA